MVPKFPGLIIRFVLLLDIEYLTRPRMTRTYTQSKHYIDYVDLCVGIVRRASVTWVVCGLGPTDR